MENPTSDLSKFGWREKRMAAKLLTAMVEQGLPEDFDDDGVTIAFNTQSGYVFATNAEYQVAMLKGDKLESFYSCPECGHEGFKDEMKHEGGPECRRYLRGIGA